MKYFEEQAKEIMKNSSTHEEKVLVLEFGCKPFVDTMYEDSEGIYSVVDDEKCYMQNWTISDDSQLYKVSEIQEALV